MANSTINFATSGDKQVVAAKAGYIIRVTGYVLMAGGTVNATFKSGSSTSLTGPFPLTAQAGVSAPLSDSEGQHQGWFETTVGQDLTLTLDANVQVSGHVKYEWIFLGTIGG
jgi:hypothetical protein